MSAPLAKNERLLIKVEMSVISRMERCAVHHPAQADMYRQVITTSWAKIDRLYDRRRVA